MIFEELARSNKPVIFGSSSWTHGEGAHLGLAESTTAAPLLPPVVASIFEYRIY